MLTEVDDAIRLTAAVQLRREQAADTLNHIQSLVRASAEAILESRKLLAHTDNLFGPLLLIREVSPEPMSSEQLEKLAALVAKARGGYAFMWDANASLPVLNPAPSNLVQ